MGESEGESQGSGESQNQTQTNSNSNTQTSNTQSVPAWKSEFGDNFDPDRAFDLITRQRKEVKDLTKSNKDLSSKVTEFESKDQTELQKMQAQLEELTKNNERLEGERKRVTVQNSFTSEAVKQGAIYPEDLWRLVDESSIEIDDDGKVTNAAKLVGEIKQNKPALFSSSRGADGGAGSNGGSPSNTNSMNDLLRRGAGR